MTSREPSSSEHWSYDVFLSFRGEDTRNGFTSHLHAALQDGGFRAFIDEDNLERGGEIKPELYAESRWCLDELVKIMECREKLRRQVLPIFYHVDPSHVRKHEGCLARAFQKHEREAKKERVKQWREALTQAANLSGHHLNNRSEAKDIKTIVENIVELLPGTGELQVAKHPVGIDSRVQPIISYLSSGELNDVKMVGIWGMGGLDKTTTANAIYNKIHPRFQFKCYLGDVSDTERRYGLVYLQKQLVSNILKQTTIFQINSEGEGTSVIKRRLQGRKVLIVIDNVDKVGQLNAIVGDREWFGPGNIIIITTRDEHLLNQVNMKYLAEKMNEEEALELFSWHTFENNCPKEYLELSKKVVSYCGGLPLALKVLGSSLFGRPIREWQSYLEKLKRIPEGEIIKKLKISFDGLDYNKKTIFLDIFCCFLGLEKDHVTKILDECGFYATSEISVLRERCLITVEWGKLKMHDLIQEMGKAIISEKFPTQPGRWSRLWNPEAITDVLTNKFASFSTKAFVNMKKLRLLRLSDVELVGSFKHFPKELRWLCWHGFPFKCMPEHFLNQPKLVALDLRFSNLRKGWKNSKPLENLKILDLCFSWKLKESPDFSRLPNLGELNFSYCSSLSKIHPSIGQLKKLTRVDFAFCKKLRYLPAEFCKLKSVETLRLMWCALRELPEGLGEMVSLRKLDASDTGIKQFPNDLGRLISLQELIVTRCKNLRAIPDLPTNLEVLDASACPAMNHFSQMSNMRKLHLIYSPKVTEVPGLGLGKSLNSMAELDMYGCTNLTAEFRNNILQGWTSCGVGGILLDKIYGIPEWFDFVADGNKVSFDVLQCECRNFKGLILCWVLSQFRHKIVALTVVNCTKHTTSRVSWPCWGIRAGHFGQVQLSNDQLKLNLQGGDKIVILLEGFGVEKTGVNLVWDKQQQQQQQQSLFPQSGRDFVLDSLSEAVPDWLYGESSPGPSHGVSDNHPTNQMTTTTDEPKRKRQKV
ncbi:unnamed protein product [Malus baccata var. baccata]